MKLFLLSWGLKGFGPPSASESGGLVRFRSQWEGNNGGLIKGSQRQGWLNGVGIDGGGGVDGVGSLGGDDDNASRRDCRWW